jgi:hypothetical protein
MSIRRFAVTIMCAVLIAASIVTCASADWYDDVKSGCTWLEIKGDNFVADTFCGVDALYNESDSYYQCNELIMRFYDEAYGLDVLAYMNTGLVMLTDGYTFVEAETPKKGDIIYVTAAMRNSGSDHWAIVKDYSDGYITMFEQNVIWDGKAAKNRQIKYPSDSYYLLTPVTLGEAPAPALRGYEQEETSTVKTTTKPETTKIVTTIPETTRVETTKPTSTQATTVRQTETQIQVSTSQAIETDVSAIIQAEETAARVSEHTTVNITEETETEEIIVLSGKGPVLLLPLLLAVVILAAIITGSVLIIKKKK